jgi:hypothetical protein
MISKRWNLLFVVPLLLATLLLASTQAAYAEERTCRGALGGITVDNLRVPQGAACTLNGTRVKGTIKVEAKATLRATNVVVNGNVQGESAARVEFVGGSVGGSIQLVQGGAARVESARINGDILFDANRSSLSAARNQIGGSLQAFQNSGGLSISNNRINGNLQCKANTPAPTGGGNQVQGSKEDQCARL